MKKPQQAPTTTQWSLSRNISLFLCDLTSPQMINGINHTLDVHWNAQCCSRREGASRVTTANFSFRLPACRTASQSTDFSEMNSRLQPFIALPSLILFTSTYSLISLSTFLSILVWRSSSLFARGGMLPSTSRRELFHFGTFHGVGVWFFWVFLPSQNSTFQTSARPTSQTFLLLAPSRWISFTAKKHAAFVVSLRRAHLSHRSLLHCGPTVLHSISS